MNSIHFRLRGCDEHRQMTWGDVQLIRDVDGIEYKNILNDRPKHELQWKFEISDQSSLMRSLLKTGQDVFVYKIYGEKRPNSMLATEAPFYPSINYSKDSGRCWFKTSAMAVNKLNSLMKTMVNKGGLDEKRRLTNHSVRKTMIQKLNDSNVPPTHIMQLSGQRNMQSVNNYSSVCKEQQKNMSLILS